MYRPPRLTLLTNRDRIAVNMTTRNGLLLAGCIAGNLAFSTISPSAWAQDNAPSQPLAAAQYRTAIETIEAREGAYGSGLTQSLMSLGQVLQKQGDHENAVDAFKRAMHLNRINEGLYNLGQVPILEELIESEIAQENWEDANDKHQYLFWLHRRNFGDTDYRLLPVIEKLSSWHLNIYTLNLSEGLHQHLVSAHALFRLAVNIIDNSYGQNDLRLVKSLRGLTATNYYLRQFRAEESMKLTHTSARGGSTPTAQERAKLDQYTINSYASGKRAMTRIVDVLDSNPEVLPSAAAKAKVGLADWYLLFDKWKSAQETYQEAYNELVASDADPRIIKSLFGRPVALPDMPLLVTEIKKTTKDTPYVLVTFDVTSYGRAKNVNIIESFPDDQMRLRSKVRRSLKAAKFRPRFENGEAVLTEQLRHRYLFPDDRKTKKEKMEKERKAQDLAARH